MFAPSFFYSFIYSFIQRTLFTQQIQFINICKVIHSAFILNRQSTTNEKSFNYWLSYPGYEPTAACSVLSQNCKITKLAL